jgi:nitroimidazol reductase NimA-like FMN-containing flavoprotein (pyridoxamine 5'-phosphate oxidase superfamily)
MTTHEATRSAQFEFAVPTLMEMSEERCHELLASKRWGRLAVGGTWPSIRPINYSFGDGDLVFRTSATSVVCATTATPIEFEIDDADPDGLWGWSVILQGVAMDITNARDRASVALRRRPVITWAPGHKDRWIKVVTIRVAGIAFGELPSPSRR